MENLLNYAHLRRDIDFSVCPFNEVDMLVCADLSYVDWDGIVDKEEVSLEKACRKYLSLYSAEELKSKYTFSMNLPHLIDALQDTIRYGSIKLKNYKKVYSDEDVIQFSVVTLVLPDGSLVLSFSGTDGSITGWKENLMMTYKSNLPCQKLAKDYVKETIENIPETSYLFGLKKKKVINFSTTGIDLRVVVPSKTSLDGFDMLAKIRYELVKEYGKANINFGNYSVEVSHI